MIAIIFGLHYSCKADLLKGVCKKKNSVNILIKIYNFGINTSILVRSQFQKHCCTINSTCVYLLYSCIENTLRVSGLICYSWQSSKPNNLSTCNMYSCVVLIAVIPNFSSAENIKWTYSCETTLTQPCTILTFWFK